MLELVGKPWFWGPEGGAEAKAALASEKEGTYLLRFSSSGSNYTLSFIADKMVWHTRVNQRYQSQRFVVDGFDEEYASLEDMIDAMKRGRRLATVCLGSPFAPFFNRAGPGDGGYRGG